MVIEKPKIILKQPEEVQEEIYHGRSSVESVWNTLYPDSMICASSMKLFPDAETYERTQGCPL